MKLKFNFFKKKKTEIQVNKSLDLDVCIGSCTPFTKLTGPREHENRDLLKYPIIFRAIDIISKSVSTFGYNYLDYSIVVDTAKLYKLFFNSFLKKVTVSLSIKRIDEQNKKIYLQISESNLGQEIENKQLNEIITLYIEHQLKLYYDLLFAYYKSSKVQGVLLPANTENQNSISFTLNEQVELSERLKGVFTDIKNNYNVIALTIPFQYVKIDGKFSDKGLIELKELIKEDVAYAFGIPSLLLENNNNSTYNNLSESQKILQDNLLFYTSIIEDLIINFIAKTKLIKSK